MGSGAGATGVVVAAGRGAGGGTAAAAGLGFDPHPAVRAELIPSAARAGSHARDVILGAPAGLRHQRKRLRRVEIPCDLAPVLRTTTACTRVRPRPRTRAGVGPGGPFRFDGRAVLLAVLFANSPPCSATAAVRARSSRLLGWEA